MLMTTKCLFHLFGFEAAAEAHHPTPTSPRDYLSITYIYILSGPGFVRLS